MQVPSTVNPNKVTDGHRAGNCRYGADVAGERHRDRGDDKPMPKATWDRIPEAKREAVIEAAEAEFAEHGYNAASLNVICREAGISKGSLFQYFSDKADLFVHLVALASKRIRASMEQAAAAYDWEHDFVGSLEALTGVWICYYYDHPRERMMLISANLEHDPLALASVRKAVYVDYLEFVGGLTDLGIALGALKESTDRDALVAAMILLLPHLGLAPHVDGLDPILGLAGAPRETAVATGVRLLRILLNQYVSAA